VKSKFEKKLKEEIVV